MEGIALHQTALRSETRRETPEVVRVRSRFVCTEDRMREPESHASGRTRFVWVCVHAFFVIGYVNARAESGETRRERAQLR